MSTTIDNIIALSKNSAAPIGARIAALESLPASPNATASATLIAMVLSGSYATELRAAAAKAAAKFVVPD